MLEIIHQKSANKKHPYPIVFIHGMGHAAWCWENFTSFFNKNGFDTYAISLRGHGKSSGAENLRWASISDYVSDVKNGIKSLPEKPILVGHSMGGFIIQKLILSGEQFPCVASLASVPYSGMLKGSLKIMMDFPTTFWKSIFTASTWRFAGNEHIVKTLCFSSQVNNTIVQNTQQRMQNESFRAYLDMLVLDLHQPKPSIVPMLFLIANDDYIVDKNELIITANKFSADVEIIEKIAHDMMLDTLWEQTANKLHHWILQKI